MSELPLTVGDDESPTALTLLEEYLATPDDPAAIGRARSIFRQWIQQQLDISDSGLSTADVIDRAASTNTKNASVAAMILRCAAVQHFLVPGGSDNHNTRSIVLLAEENLPELCRFLKIEPHSQTFEKYSIIESCFSRIQTILSPLSERYEILDALISARKAIMGALSHSIVAEYCASFYLSESRNAVQTVYSNLAKITSIETTFSYDVDDLREYVKQTRQSGKEVGGFLYNELCRFLDSVERCLDSYIASLKGRFSTRLERVNNTLSELQKRYPLHEAGRIIHISVPFRNHGPGVALNVAVSITANQDEILPRISSWELGSIAPGEFSIIFEAEVVSPLKQFEFLLEVEWQELGSPAKTRELHDLRVVAQRADIDWGALRYWHPYTLEVAEGEDFVGRAEKVEAIAGKLLRSPMEPFYITGQKRVGKTSLSKAVVSFASRLSKDSSIVSGYIMWGKIAIEDPYRSLEMLGREIEELIFSNLPANLHKETRNYQGTLSPLIKVAEFALSVAPNTKFVIILDEFDEIHQELYLQGNLADTVFANIRALTSCRNVSLILVGGENMPFIMQRQGQRLNKYSRINLSYFSREEEWEDFATLVRRPTEGIISWNDSAVNEAFNLTNGNPYFTKALCNQVLLNCVSERDSDVTAAEVKRAAELCLSTLEAHNFAHLWQDGIFKATSEREPDILRRQRVLVALGRCLRNGKARTIGNICDNRHSRNLSEAEVPAVLHDLVRREILRESGEEYVFVLPLFEMWLSDVGVTRLIGDALSEELAAQARAEEDKAFVRAEEVVHLAGRWPNYRGMPIGSDDIKRWYQQEENVIDQRILFKLLQHVRFVTESEVGEKLRAAHTRLLPRLPGFVSKKLSDRRQDVLITYIDGEGKSGQYYASLYAEENRISVNSVLAPSEVAAEAQRRMEASRVSAIVVIDDFAGTGRSLSDNVGRFYGDNEGIFSHHKIPLYVFTLLCTPAADDNIRTKLSGFGADCIDFRSCEIVGPECFAFSEVNRIWESGAERDRAKALCTDLGSRIYKRNPLGLGGDGLLVVFPRTVPNNTLPILHSRSKAGNKNRWTPLFPRVVN